MANVFDGRYMLKKKQGDLLKESESKVDIQIKGISAFATDALTVCRSQIIA